MGISSQKKVSHKFLVEVCPFSVAVKLTINDEKLDHAIQHTGTNDLGSDKTASQIARSITELAMSLKDNDNSVIVSGIFSRNQNLNNKAIEVNDRLLPMCK